MEEDANDRNLFFISEGEISFYLHKNDEERKLYKLKKGDFFGQHSFTIGQKSLYYAKTSTHSSLFKLSFNEFIAILKETPRDYVSLFCVNKKKNLKFLF